MMIKIVEIVGDENQSAEQVLLKTSFQGPVPLGLQVEVGELELAADEGLFKSRFLDTCGIREIQSSTGEQVPAVQSLKSDGDSRNAGVAEGCVVNKAPARDHTEPSQGQRLLPISCLVQAQPTTATCEVRRYRVIDRAVFILELITDCGLRPSALNIIALIVEAGAVDADQGRERRVDGAKGSVLRRNAAIQVLGLQVVFEAREVVRPI